MKESYGEGLASHTGPEACADLPRDDSEALTQRNKKQVNNGYDETANP